MTAFGWNTTRPHKKLSHVASLLPRRNPRKPARRGVTPGLERLESIEVLSVAPLIAQAILSVFEDSSVSEIFGGRNQS